LLEGAVGHVAADGALVAHHEEDILRVCDCREALTDRIAFAQAEQVVVEKNIPTTVAPWVPSSSCGKIIVANLKVDAVLVAKT